MTASARRIFLEAGIIFCVGMVLGLSFNFQLVMDAFSGRISTIPHPVLTPVEKVGATTSLTKPVALPFPVMLDEIRQLLDEGAVILDARTAESYAEGHLAKALSLPFGEMDARLPTIKETVSPKTVLITYCSGFGCPDSFDLGLRLLAEGYIDVRVYEGGYPEWRDAGLPVETGAP